MSTPSVDGGFGSDESVIGVWTSELELATRNCNAAVYMGEHITLDAKTVRIAPKAR